MMHLQDFTISRHNNGNRFFHKPESSAVDMMPTFQAPHSDTRDLREVYAASKASRSGSARSLSSCTTDCSTATNPASNTTTATRERKKQKRRFRAVANRLMEFLEKWDPRVFNKAQQVIRDCERRKERGEAGYESVTESLKEPLKEVVGATYWKLATVHSKAGSDLCHHLHNPPLLANDSTPATIESDTTSPWGRQLNQPQTPPPLPPQPFHCDSPLSTNSQCNPAEEKRVRHERFVIILRVILRYLKEKNPELHRNVKCTVMECSVAQKGGRQDLIKSIQTAVKDLVGVRLWRHAESILSKAITKQAEEEAMDAIWDTEPILFDLSLTERWCDLSNDQQTKPSCSKRIQIQPTRDIHDILAPTCHVVATTSTKKRTISFEEAIIPPVSDDAAWTGASPRPMPYTVPDSIGVNRKRRRLLMQIKSRE